MIVMKLYITHPSPFARKCRIVACAKGLIERIEEIAVDPYANAPELLASNPIVQVPTLIADDGLPISDSPVICEYLDALGSGPSLLPPEGPERLRVRRMETQANAALEMGVKLLLELRRPEGERSPSWMARWTEKRAAPSMRWRPPVPTPPGSTWASSPPASPWPGSASATPATTGAPGVRSSRPCTQRWKPDPAFRKPGPVETRDHAPVIDGDRRGCQICRRSAGGGPIFLWGLP